MGVETYGAYGPQGIKLVKQMGKKIQDATGENFSTFFLFQNISMAIQRGNAVMGCPKDISYSIFKYMKLKSYYKKNIHIYT